MALNIDLVNGAINVYETDQVPRTYFGVIGASGKFYPSGTIGAVSTNGMFAYTIISNTTAGCDNDTYDNQSQASTSGNGSGGLFKVEIGGGMISLIQPATGVDFWSGSGSGYVVKDTITFNGSDYGGTGKCIISVDGLGVDGFLIVIGGDDYQVGWSDLVINGTSPTSLQNAQELLSTLFSSLSLTPKYKIYSALLTQVDDIAPVATILENTIGEIVWTWNDVGDYVGTLSNAFPIDKTQCFIGSGIAANNIPILFARRNSNSTIGISSIDVDGSTYDNQLSNTPIEIRVYN